jgi:hypothetical protein
MPLTFQEKMRRRLRFPDGVWGGDQFVVSIEEDWRRCRRSGGELILRRCFGIFC